MSNLRQPESNEDECNAGAIARRRRCLRRSAAARAGHPPTEACRIGQLARPCLSAAYNSVQFDEGPHPPEQEPRSRRCERLPYAEHFLVMQYMETCVHEACIPTLNEPGPAEEISHQVSHPSAPAYGYQRTAILADEFFLRQGVVAKLVVEPACEVFRLLMRSLCARGNRFAFTVDRVRTITDRKDNTWVANPEP